MRAETKKDLPGVLQAIRRIGYQEVELYGDVYDQPASELKRLLEEHGLTAPSGHFDHDAVASKLDYAHELGVRYVICPILPEPMRNSLDNFKRAADQFNVWGEKARALGMTFGFHNHNYEFFRFGDTTGFDTIVARTDPKLVCLEIDCYWITQAGRDPIATLRQLAGRVPLIHVKDRKPGFPQSQQFDTSAEHFTEVGTGSIDWRAVIAAARKAGVEHYFVEQDSTERPALESIAISYRNLRQIV